MKILITAFQPFGGRKNNTSEDALSCLRKHPFQKGVLTTCFAVLPVNFRTTWPTLRKIINKAQPDALLMFGERDSQGVAIETTARNRRRHQKGDTQIEKSGREKLYTIFDARTLANSIGNKSASAKDRWKVSNNAGDYLCNFIYWKVLAHQSGLPCVFVHVPALAAAKSEVETAHIARQATLLINEMVKQLRKFRKSQN